MMAFKRYQKDVSGICLMAWIVMLCLVLVGCSDGKNSDNDDSPHLSYSGINTSAAIREDNTEALAINAINAGVSCTTFTCAVDLPEAEQLNVSSNSFLFDLALALDGTIGKIDVLTIPVQDLKEGIVSDSNTIEGNCGGIAAITIDMDTDTGAFNGSITFSNFCEDGIFIDGETGFYGVFNLMIGKLDSFTLEFDYMNAITSSKSMIMDGEIYMDVSVTTTMATMNMMIQEIDTGGVCKIENYQMDITHGYTDIDIAVNGRYYHPDYGYVDIETTQPFQLNNGDNSPSYGAMIFTGETGSAGGPTRALFTIYSGVYQIEVDTDGDGEYDYTP